MRTVVDNSGAAVLMVRTIIKMNVITGMSMMTVMIQIVMISMVMMTAMVVTMMAKTIVVMI